MASFSLRSQRTGQYKAFSLLEILKLLGDSVNDEIWLEDGEDVYNLSSFREIGGGNGSGGSVENWSVETPGNIAFQSIFYLLYIPKHPVILVLLNGVTLTQHKDYTLEEKELRLPFQLNTQDTLKFIYQY